MARIMSRSRAVSEGNPAMKFSELIVICCAIAGIVVGVRWFVDYRRSASFALQEFVGSIKSGNVKQQYSFIDDHDKNAFFQSQDKYEGSSTLAHGYVERIENSSLGQELKSPESADKVTIPLTVSIRAAAEGKQLYQTGQSLTSVDNIVMHKGADGKWRVVLSESIDKDTSKLHLQNAQPSATSSY